MRAQAPLHLILAACTHHAVAPVASSAPPGPCIAGDAHADSIRVDGEAVHLCAGAGAARTCWRGDVAQQRFTAEAVTPPPEVSRNFDQVLRAHAEVAPNGQLALCPPGGGACTQVANPGPSTSSDLVGVSDDLATIAIPDGQILRVYDVAGARVRTTIHAWPSPMAANGFTTAPDLAGDRLIVWLSETPISEQGRIFDLHGKQLAVVGPDGFTVVDHGFRLSPTAWAFKQIDGNALVVVDVRRPDAQTTYDLAPLASGADPVVLDAVARVRDRLVVITEQAAIGILEGRAIARFAPPVCR